MIEKTKAGFRLERVSLGLEPMHIARVLHVEPKIASVWESPKNFYSIPEAAWKVLGFVRNWHDTRVRAFVLLAKELVEQNNGEKPEHVPIPMYRTEQVWRSFAVKRGDPKMIDFRMANAASWDAGQRLSDAGFSVRFYYPDLDQPGIEYVESFGRTYEEPVVSVDESMLM